MKKGDVLTLKIEDYAFEGKGIARIDQPGLEESDKKFVVLEHFLLVWHKIRTFEEKN